MRQIVAVGSKKAEKIRQVYFVKGRLDRVFIPLAGTIPNPFGIEDPEFRTSSTGKPVPNRPKHRTRNNTPWQVLATGWPIRASRDYELLSEPHEPAHP